MSVTGVAGSYKTLWYGPTTGEGMGAIFCGNNPIGMSSGILRVDSVWGNDTNATANKFQVPFKTVSAALTNAASGHTVYVNPGTYVETSPLVLNSGVALRGANTQTVNISYTGSGQLITVSNGRIEDVTLTATASGAVTMKGIVLTNAQTFKLRSAVVNVVGATGSTIYGLYCDTSGSVATSSSNAVRGSTINVTGAPSDVLAYGIYLHTTARMTLRDTNVFSNGGTRSIGAVCDVSGGILEIKTATLNGTFADISEDAGIISISGTDLINSNANGKGFTVGITPTTMFFGVLGNINQTTTHYLYPGTVPFASLSTTPVGFSMSQKCIIHDLTLRTSAGPGSTYTLTCTVTNVTTSQSLSVTLTGAETYKQNDVGSFTVNIADIIRVTMVASNNSVVGDNPILSFIMY